MSDNGSRTEILLKEYVEAGLQARASHNTFKFALSIAAGTTGFAFHLLASSPSIVGVLFLFVAAASSAYSARVIDRCERYSDAYFDRLRVIERELDMRLYTVGFEATGGSSRKIGSQKVAARFLWFGAIFLAIYGVYRLVT